MMRDVLTVFWKEGREILEMSGPRGGFARLLVWFGVFGVFLPLQSGEAWLSSPAALLMWIWFPIFVVSNATAGAVAGERERHTLETLLASRLPDRAILFGKILAGVAYGWILTLISIVMGMVTVNLALPGVRFLAPALAAGGPILSLLSAFAAAAVGTHVSLYAPTARQAQQALSLATLLLFLAPTLGVQSLPAGTRARLAAAVSSLPVGRAVAAAALALAVLDAILLVAAVARFRRDRLLLD